MITRRTFLLSAASGLVVAAIAAFLLRGLADDYALAPTLALALSGALSIKESSPWTLWAIPVTAGAALMSVVILSRSSGPLYVLAFAAAMAGVIGLVFSFSSSAVFAPPAPETLVRLSRLPAGPVPVTVSGARTGSTYYAGRVTPTQAACLARTVAPMPGDPRLVRTPQYEPVRVRAGTPEQARLISSALTDIDDLRRSGIARCRAFRTSGGVTFEQPTLTGLSRSGAAASSAVTLP